MGSKYCYNKTWKSKDRKSKAISRQYSEFKCEKVHWSEAEDEMLLSGEMTDAELSDAIDRTIPAIRIRRCKLLKGMKSDD